MFYFPTGSWCQILPYYRVDHCHSGPINVTYATNLEDYYLHLRQSYILPFQNSTDSKVNTTKDLSMEFMDYLILPTATNEPLSTGKTSDNAAAFGYIYYDDGVSHAQAQGRFDFYMKLYVVNNTNNGANFTVQVAENGTRSNTDEEVVGQIRIFQASTALLQGVTAAKVHTRSGAVIPVIRVVYDATDDQLTVIVSERGSVPYINVYDLSHIEMMS